ncbi:hemolysin-III-like protein 2 [Elsinoe fawcettii]|nr:hemolysin-III-like protein 2 [Elsinoe fawcettii]
MPSRRKSPGPLNPLPRQAAQDSSKLASPLPTPPLTSPLRPILRKKKSVTFHPSTKIPVSQQNTPDPSTGTFSPLASPNTDPLSFFDDPTLTSPPSHPMPPPTQPSSSSTSFFSRPKLLDYAHLPPWRHDNAFILSSYRPQAFSHRASLPSLFYLHNESCNIWSHLLGLAFFASFGVTFLASLSATYPSATDGDWWAFAAFFGGVCTCLAASSLFHLFHDVGPVEAKRWNGLDYAGIVACIWGSFVACLHFGFDEGDRGVRRGYEGMITLLGIGCVGVSVLQRFRTPEWRAFRAGMFVFMGISAVLPVGHGVVLYGVEGLERRMGLSWVVRQGVL